MNITQFRTLALGAVAGLALIACNRAEPPAEVNSDVQDAQIDKAEEVASAQSNQAEVQADTASAAGSADPDDRGDAVQKLDN